MKYGQFSPAMVLISLLALSGCNSDSSSLSVTPKPKPDSGLEETTTVLGIEAIPQALAATYTSQLKFNRYTKVVAPNGKAIHILAQDQLSDNQIVRARSILEHYLTPLAGSEFGSDKTAVANKMTDNHATLLLLNGSDDGSNPATELEGQPLYQNEIQVEGHPWYIEQNYEHRDASFEEILHMVHDTGIGVDQGQQFAGALPAFQSEIRSAQVAALNGALWGIGEENKGWIQELTAENSLSQEYLAAVIDSYYGLWGAWQQSQTQGMWGLYIAKTREEIRQEDPAGWQLMSHKFFHPYLTYNARIDESFSGDFSLKLNHSRPYTHHSQYLKDVTLTGDKAANVIVNGFDNHITGNRAKNRVIFSGQSAQYTVETRSDGSVVVSDMVDDRDGVNTLVGIETLGFSDTDISL
ncbi:hypothetical protein [Ferrimonas kyonanensis]|uniref:hypothetical protein n=1 Tax=Ferrimonas kyonanensis TaxID=364763 RepID=UPI000420D836|nr:hypothetical protein [Ferrimonas kyonanensis]